MGRVYTAIDMGAETSAKISFAKRNHRFYLRFSANLITDINLILAFTNFGPLLLWIVNIIYHFRIETTLTG